MADQKKKKANGKAGKPTVEKHERSVLFLLPEKVTAAELAGELTFLDRKQIEVWTDVNILELTFENGTLTFEDIMQDLGAGDEALLSSIGKKQVYACDYLEEDREMVKKVMKILIEKYLGVIASDTEDFRPYLSLEDL